MTNVHREHEKFKSVMTSTLFLSAESPAMSWIHLKDRDTPSTADVAVPPLCCSLKTQMPAKPAHGHQPQAQNRDWFKLQRSPSPTWAVLVCECRAVSRVGTDTKPLCASS